MKDSRWTRTWIIIVVALLYLLTRAGHLSRELASEEGIFLMQGRHLFEGKGYSFYFGETGGKRSNPFHKPPLTSLLLGAFSYVGHDMVSGARLVPLLVGLFICLLPLLVTGSVLPSILVLMAPFLYAASSHMQTDPTVGLLGYGLLCWAMHLWYEGKYRTARNLLWSGLLVLWLGKIEIAVIASTVLIVSLFAFRMPERRAFVRHLLWASCAGVASFLMASWILGAISGFSFSESVGFVVGTVKRITGGLLKETVSSPTHGTAGRAALFKALNQYQVPILFLILFIPAWAIIIKKKIYKESGYPGFLTLAAIVPVIVYLVGAYPSDGFPRYFLIAFPPLLLLLGTALNRLESRPRMILQVGLLIVSVIVMAPMTLSMWKAPGVVTVGRGIEGYRRCAQFVEVFTQPGDLVLGMEPLVPYLRGRKFLVQEAVEPYPDTHEKALSLAPQLKAAVIYRLPSPSQRYEGILGKLVKSLEERGAKSYYYGVFEILVLEMKRE